VFKVAIWANGETKDEDMVNLLISTLCDTISKWT
jgi:hypothetical protein